MEADGSNKIRSTYFNEQGHPEYIGKRTIVSDNSWSPDGGRIATSIAYEFIWRLKSRIMMMELDNP
ncbi:MAG TPA: hypothetical protein EYP71_03685 [Dehalococcoidia bacterium]|nr:hypothetical protein [Dehalococcoidia bacterium]